MFIELGFGVFNVDILVLLGTYWVGPVITLWNIDGIAETSKLLERYNFSSEYFNCYSKEFNALEPVLGSDFYS